MEKKRNRNQHKFPALTDRIVGRTQDGRNVYENELDSEGKTSVSSERSITFKVGESFYNFPSMFNGKQLEEPEIKDIFRKNKGVDPETGLQAQPFTSEKAAIKAAMAKSRGLGVQ